MRPGGVEQPSGSPGCLVDATVDGLVDPAAHLVVVHSSDLHLAQDPAVETLELLGRVVRTARAARAQVLLLAGDIFDHNRVPLPLLDRAARLLADAADLEVVVLPGNHDCLTRESVYCRGGLADPPNVHVLGVSVDEAIVLPGLGLEVWGRPHQDYADMAPLGDPRPRSAARQIAMAHGHWVTGHFDRLRSWRIHDEEIAATGADYVALGHWDGATRVGDGRVPAYYSGSPTFAGTVNVVRFTRQGGVTVTRERVVSGPWSVDRAGDRLTPDP